MMKNILAAPFRGSASLTSDQGADASGGYASWRLVERRLLSPARRDAVECLVRLERADGMREQWRAGDLAELQGPFSADGIEPTPFATSFRGPRYAAVSLLLGGWPADDWVRRTSASLCLPIASGGRSTTLDLLVFSGNDANPALDTETRQRLLLDTTVNLRILRSPTRWAPDGPFLFIGDFAAAALARAFVQEHRSEDLVFLIESGLGEASLSPQAILRRECWRDGAVGTMPKLGSISELSSLLGTHRQKVRVLLQRDASIVVAGASENFISLINAGLRGFLGDEATAVLEAAGRLKEIAI